MPPLWRILFSGDVSIARTLFKRLLTIERSSGANIKNQATKAKEASVSIRLIVLWAVPAGKATRIMGSKEVPIIKPIRLIAKAPAGKSRSAIRNNTTVSIIIRPTHAMAAPSMP